MAYERKNGDFILFRNKYKEAGDKKPDWKGEILIAGETLDISAWVKNGQKGEFLTGNISHKRDKAAAGKNETRPTAPATTAPTPADAAMDSLPF